MRIAARHISSDFSNERFERRVFTVAPTIILEDTAPATLTHRCALWPSTNGSRASAGPGRI
jgi:hypothetical protein